MGMDACILLKRIILGPTRILLLMFIFHRMAHPGVFVGFIFIACLVAIATMLLGSWFEDKRKMTSPGGFWFYGLICGFVICLIAVIGGYLAMHP